MDTDKEIRDIKEMVRENNRILKKMQSRFRWATIGTVVKWIIYLGILFGTWYYLQPFFDQMKETFISIQEAGGAVSGLKENEELRPLLEFFGRE